MHDQQTSSVAYAITTDNLSRQYGSVTAVKELHLRVLTGSVYGFLGPNGAGKTTTIRMLLGLLRPDRGDIHIMGCSIRQQREKVLRYVGALVETPSLYAHLTGRENLEITRRLLNVSTSHIDEVLNRVDLTAAAHRTVRGYSLGMRQRLALALALLGRPKILILDEPMNGLDPSGMQDMRHLIRLLSQEQGITIFLSSHMLSEVEHVATHIGIIQRGQLIFQGPLADLQQQRQEYIVVRVNQPELALQILTQSGWQVSYGQDQQLIISLRGEENIARVNALLAQHGLNVFHLSTETPSLEETFLHITQATG